MDDVTLTCEELECFVTESKPNGFTNLAFPSDVRSGAQWYGFKIDENSTTANFIKPKRRNQFNNNYGKSNPFHPNSPFLGNNYGGQNYGNKGLRNISKYKNGP